MIAKCSATQELDFLRDCQYINIVLESGCVNPLACDISKYGFFEHQKSAVIFMQKLNTVNPVAILALRLEIGFLFISAGKRSGHNYDGVVKVLHLLRYRDFSKTRHTIWLPSSLENSYALYIRFLLSHLK
jgi:hypothetical protein